MRQIFSIRFFAAVGAVVGLFFVLTTIFATREVIEGDNASDQGVMTRRIDFVDEVFASLNPSFRIDLDGTVVRDTDFVIDGQRRIRVVAGTPGESHCDVLGPSGSCAIVTDLLGEGVVWFALVPMGSNDTVEFPAIDGLADGLATLVNGWQLPYAPVLDRRCQDELGNDVEYASYRDFRDALGDDFTSVYSIDERRLVAVECRSRVPYAPESSSTTTSSTTTAPGTIPGP